MQGRDVPALTGKHTPHLMVAPFGEGEAGVEVVDDFQLGRQAGMRFAF